MINFFGNKSNNQDSVGVSPLFDIAKLESETRSKAEILLSHFRFPEKMQGHMPVVLNMF